MTCLLNTFGKLSNLENIIAFLSKSEDSPLSASEILERSDSNETSNSKMHILNLLKL